LTPAQMRRAETRQQHCAVLCFLAEAPVQGPETLKGPENPYAAVACAPRAEFPVPTWMHRLSATTKTEASVFVSSPSPLHLASFKKAEISTECSVHTTRVTVTKQTGHDKPWPGCREPGPLMHGWWEWKMVQPCGSSVVTLKNASELLSGPAIPLLFGGWQD
jgi:hypothetical protein